MMNIVLNISRNYYDWLLIKEQQSNTSLLCNILEPFKIKTDSKHSILAYKTAIFSGQLIEPLNPSSDKSTKIFPTTHE